MVAFEVLARHLLDASGKHWNSENTCLLLQRSCSCSVWARASQGSSALLGGPRTRWDRAPRTWERSVTGLCQAAVVPSHGCVGQKEALDQPLRQQLKLMAVTSGNPGRCLRSPCWGSLMNCRQDTDVLPRRSGMWPLVRQRGRRPTVPLSLRFSISRHSRLQIINYHGAAHL